MKVHRNIKSDKKTIAQLCEVLLPDEMYLCQPLYNLISAGLEGGEMKGGEKEGREKEGGYSWWGLGLQVVA